MSGKKLSIDDILAKKKIVEQKHKNYFSDYFDAEIEIEKINAAKISDIIFSDEEQYRKYLKLIYATCPIFRNKELVKEYEVEEPYAVVEKAFDTSLAEIYALGNHILSDYGFSEDKVEQIKKQSEKIVS